MNISWWTNNQIPQVFETDQTKTVIAFCGAGGKTSAMALLAAQLNQRDRIAYLTTTTNVYSRHSQTIIPNVIRETFLNNDVFAKVSMGTYTIITEVGKLKETQLKKKMECMNNHNAYWLVEADGARHAYLKAPLINEPCWPDELDLAVGCFSANILGQASDYQASSQQGWGGIHRLAHFLELTGLAEGEIVDVAALATLILHPEGMFRGLDPSVPRVVLATQVKPSHRAALVELGQRLSIPMLIREWGESPIEPVPIKPYPLRVVAGVMAGGSGHRMGEGINKLLLPLADSCLLKASLATPLSLVKSGVFEELVIVSGHEAVFDIALEFRVSYIHNPSAEKGLSEGLKLLARYGQDPEVDAVCIFMGDQPFVDEGLVRLLLEALIQAPDAVAAIPTYEGIRLNPVVVRSSFLKTFETLSGDRGAKALLEEAPCVLCAWDKPEAFKDADTLADYQWILDFKRRAEGV